MIFQNEKTPFQIIKTRSSKRRKIDIFSKGVNPWFWSKNGHFPFFFDALQTRKMYSLIFQNEKTPFQAIKRRRYKKSKNSHSFKVVNPWYWSKNGHFSNFYFLRIIEKENVFYDILERENTFLAYKNQKFKKSKN